MTKHAPIIVLGLIGIAITGSLIMFQLREPQAPKLNSILPVPPYQSYIAAEGSIEGAGRNIRINAPYAQLIRRIMVHSGQQVTCGAPLLQLDSRTLDAEIKQAEAVVTQRRVEMNEQQTIFGFYQHLKESGSVSSKEFQQAYYAYLAAVEAFEVARKDLAIALSKREQAIIRAPTDGTVLAINTQIGEIAQTADINGKPLIMFTDTSVMNIRVYVAEEDAWRVIPGAEGTAFVRGNASIKCNLTYDYSEPYLIAKSAITGRDTELVDTRVLQLVYHCSTPSGSIYPGQLVDVYLEALPHEA